MSENELSNSGNLLSKSDYLLIDSIIEKAAAATSDGHFKLAVSELENAVSRLEIVGGADEKVKELRATAAELKDLVEKASSN